MPLRIDTFSNQVGGFAFFKAIGHPLTAESLTALLRRVASRGLVAVYDPLGHLGTLAELYDLSGLSIESIYVQAIERLDETILGQQLRPITDISESGARTLLIVGFDTGRLADHIRHLLPAGMDIASLDDARLPDALLTNTRRYLDPLNFATNHALLRDSEGRHTRLVTANYWSGYGAGQIRLWCRQFDQTGKPLGTWEQTLDKDTSGVVIDSREVRERLGLGDFTGTLFIHAIGARGHDIVKYAVDTYGDDPDELSCTHDANAWPADLYAGLPAPQQGERVTLWLQNAHPTPVPAGGIGLNLMGRSDVRKLSEPIPGFGCYPLDTTTLFPNSRWPAQFEIRAGKHVVRPRYEVASANGRNRIAHVNVERVDLQPDPKIASATRHMGRGFILPAPMLPVARYRSFALPTPMSTGQFKLPVRMVLHDSEGREIAQHKFGMLDRSDSVAVEVAEVLDGIVPDGGYGHMELLYDFDTEGAEAEADGWLHGLFRYEDRVTGHAADTSFGAHVFNGIMTFKGEPQSYGGPPPGLSTRLFLRIGQAMGGGEIDTMCHLIYPASTEWHAASETELVLTGSDGVPIATTRMDIPRGGSRFWRVSEMFGPDHIAKVGRGGYVLIRDTTCRLFGYHGLIRDGHAFSLDHMFGF